MDTLNGFCRGRIATAVSLAVLLVGGLLGGAFPASAAASYSSVILAGSPLAYWRLNEAPHSAKAVDDTGHRHNGTYAACVRLGQKGPIRKDRDTAGFFGKPGCWMLYKPSKSYAGAYSVEAWVRPQSSSKTYQTIFDTRSLVGEYSFDFSLCGSRYAGGKVLHIDVGDGHEWLTSDTGYDARFAFRAGSWYYVAATVIPWKHLAVLYVNGRVLGKDRLQYYRLSPLLFDRYHAIAIGGNPRYDLEKGNPLPGNFDGTIGQVAVYERVLTPAEIAAHYQAGHSAYYK